jgi:hypothetical protein
MKTLLVCLFFPFVFFILWGPFAFFYAARKVVDRLCMRHDPAATVVRSFLILIALFLPVAVTSPGGNIPAVLPWWVAVLGMWLPLEAGVEFSVGSFVPAIVAAPVALWIISREVRRRQARQSTRGGLS